MSTAGLHSTWRDAKWDKLLSIHDALRSCSIVLHADADVVFRRPFQLQPLARTWLSATRDYIGLNSGVLLVRRSAQARQLLQFAWDQLSFNGSFNAEQNGLRLGLRRPYDAPSRSRAAAVSILEALVEYPFYHSALLARARKERNFTAPLYHAAGCSASRARVSSGFCDKILLKQVRRSDMGSGCPSIEEVYFTGSQLPASPPRARCHQHGSSLAQGS